jgi:hypothetical protein
VRRVTDASRVVNGKSSTLVVIRRVAVKPPVRGERYSLIVELKRAVAVDHDRGVAWRWVIVVAAQDDEVRRKRCEWQEIEASE